ncbi:MAG: polysaccharide deacetylase family protein [Polyangiales bacterium]
MKSHTNKVLAFGFGSVLAGCVATPADDAPEKVDRSSAALSMPSDVAHLPFFDDGPWSDAVALTFDDGPDTAGATDAVLDTLGARGISATFFVNSKNACSVSSNTDCQRQLRRIVDEGHALGNHTARHRDLTTLSATTVETEFADVDAVIQAFLPDAGAPTLVRAPYGAPFISGSQTQLNEIGPIAAHHGVHIGWNIDSNDSGSCADDETCIRNTIVTALDSGKRGIILMHSISWATATALPAILDELDARGLWVASIEDMVQARYGVPSASLVR